MALTLEEQVAQLTQNTQALLDALVVRADEIRAVIGDPLAAAIRACAENITSITSAVQAAATATDGATRSENSATAAHNSEVAAAASASTALSNANVTVTKAAEVLSNATSASNSASSAANIQAAMSAALASFRQLFLGKFATDSDAVAFATANGITLQDGTMYENTTGTPNKFRIYNGTSWDDYDSTAQTLQASAQLSATQAASSAGSAAADRTQTGLDRTATAADRVQTGQDKTATASDRAQTGQDKLATAADRTQTGLDRTAVAADRMQTGLDKVAAAASALQAQQVLAEAVSLNPNLNPAIRTNARSITQDTLVASGNNAGSVGPISIAHGVRVTIQPGARWKIN